MTIFVYRNGYGKYASVELFARARGVRYGTELYLSSASLSASKSASSIGISVAEDFEDVVVVDDVTEDSSEFFSEIVVSAIEAFSCSVDVFVAAAVVVVVDDAVVVEAVVVLRLVGLRVGASISSREFAVVVEELPFRGLNCFLGDFVVAWKRDLTSKTSSGFLNGVCSAAWNNGFFSPNGWFGPYIDNMLFVLVGWRIGITV